jgi:hypothetical protein
MTRIAAATALLALAACTPTFNWREVSVPSTALKATMPCKPKSVERRTEFTPGREIVVHAFGCEAGGATFAILSADLGSAMELGPGLAQWKSASLAAMHGVATRETPYAPQGAMGLPQSVQIVARGRRADGGAVQSQAAYFAHGTRVFQAVVVADRIRPEMTEPFFTGLRID